MRQLNGELDDMAFFGQTLTTAEVAERWNQSLTDRRLAGSEPNLIVFWNFDDPVSEAGFVPNLGSAGRDFDLRLGDVDKNCGTSAAAIGAIVARTGRSTTASLAHLSLLLRAPRIVRWSVVCASKFTTGGRGSLATTIYAPAIVPATDSSAWSTPKALTAAAPLVRLVSPGEAVSSRVSTVSRGRPTSPVRSAPHRLFRLLLQVHLSTFTSCQSNGPWCHWVRAPDCALQMV
jgi:hypothetical protein